MDMNERNRRIIEEFRANVGEVGGPFAGAPMVVLHTRGARTGRERLNPLVYLPDGDRVVVFASYGGAPTNPDWYHNLVAHPDVRVELGTRTVPARAEVVTGAERDRLYAEMSRARPGFGEYQERTSRTIPVVLLRLER